MFEKERFTMTLPREQEPKVVVGGRSLIPVTDVSVLTPKFMDKPVEKLALKPGKYMRHDNDMSEMAERLPLRLPEKQFENKAELFRTYANVVAGVGRIETDYRRVISGIFRAARMDPEGIDGCMEIFRKERQQLSLEMAAEVAGLPVELARGQMEPALANARIVLANVFPVLLEYCVQSEACGRIFWMSTDAAVFDWQEWVFGRTQMATRTSVQGRERTITTNHDEVWTKRLHRHTILSPSPFPPKIYDDMPARIHPLINAILAAEYLVPEIQILYGEEIVHDVVEKVVNKTIVKDVRRERIPDPVRRQVYRKDPAVICRDKCLAGWKTGEK